MAKCDVIVYYAVSRVVYVFYIVLSICGFLEARKMYETKAKKQGGTLYIPFMQCDAEELTKNTKITDVNDVEGCRILSFIVRSCTASLLLSAFSVLVYIIVEWMISRKKGPFNKSMLLGMGFFLIVILVQTVASTWALAKESDEFVDATDSFYKAISWDSNYDHLSVHASTWYLWLAGALAAIAGIFVVIDVISALYNRQKRRNNNNNHEMELPATNSTVDPSSSSVVNSHDLELPVVVRETSQPMVSIESATSVPWAKV